MRNFRKSAGHWKERFRNQHRFEHWYRDNSVYFITSSTRDHFPAFWTEKAKTVFWDRFLFYSQTHGFEPWIVSLLDNHYHALGYVGRARDLGQMMRKIHGSVAKLTNDLLEERRRPFWRERGGRDYFDGCLRDLEQLRKAYMYTFRQSKRHGICADPTDYSHTRIWTGLDDALRLAVERNALMSTVPYARYQRGNKRHRRGR